MLANFCLSLLLAAAAQAPSVDLRHGELRVSLNHRYLVHQDGVPFFYLGDTAWELFHRLNREQAEQYLENRRKKRFTVIQAVALAEFDGLNTPNPYGDRPLLDNDPSKPNDAYFRHVDFILKIAEQKGLFIGLLPTWGDKVRKDWGIGPVVFNPENANAYGRWLGKRYRNQPNIIWILGGDRRADGQEAVWRAMAEGIKEGDSGRHLMTYHPQGGTSSAQFWPNEPWLDFQMLQSGHASRDLPNYEMIAHDYVHEPIKPVIDGESRYEDHPVNWKAANGYFDDFDVRQAAYWALFAGAPGHTYGCHDIWQFFEPGLREPISAARTDWRHAMDLPGASQMRYVRALMESRPQLERVPDQTLLANPGEGAGHLQATRSRSYLFVYSPLGNPIAVELGHITGRRVAAWWFNPRQGNARRIGTFANSGDRTFTPPGTPGRGNDWVLVVDDAEVRFRRPGK